MQIRLYLIKYAQFCIFSVDGSEHMIKPGAIYFFHFVHTQDEKKKKRKFRGISGYMLSLGNQNILSIPLKKTKKKQRFSPYFYN